MYRGMIVFFDLVTRALGAREELSQGVGKNPSQRPLLHPLPGSGREQVLIKNCVPPLRSLPSVTDITLAIAREGMQLQIDVNSEGGGLRKHYSIATLDECEILNASLSKSGIPFALRVRPREFSALLSSFPASLMEITIIALLPEVRMPDPEQLLGMPCDALISSDHRPRPQFLSPSALLPPCARARFLCILLLFPDTLEDFYVHALNAWGCGRTLSVLARYAMIRLD